MKYQQATRAEEIHVVNRQKIQRSKERKTANQCVAEDIKYHLASVFGFGPLRLRVVFVSMFLVSVLALLCLVCFVIIFYDTLSSVYLYFSCDINV